MDSDLGNFNYLSWYVSGCGYVGLMHNETLLPPPPSPETCSDDDVLANALIGQCNDPATCASEDPDYEANICQLITTVWGGGYCANVIFARICPASCFVDCFADDEAAVRQYMSVVGVEVATGKNSPSVCEQLSAAVGCADPVLS